MNVGQDVTFFIDDHPEPRCIAAASPGRTATSYPPPVEKEPRCRWTVLLLMLTTLGITFSTARTVSSRLVSVVASAPGANQRTKVKAIQLRKKFIFLPTFRRQREDR
jgi:hypothetical protein